MFPIISKEDGNKSVKDTQIITPAAKASDEIKILLSVFLKKITILPIIVAKPEKAEISKL